MFSSSQNYISPLPKLIITVPFSNVRHSYANGVRFPQSRASLNLAAGYVNCSFSGYLKSAQVNT